MSAKITLHTTINDCVKLTIYPFLSAFKIVFKLKENIYCINKLTDKIKVNEKTYKYPKFILKNIGYNDANINVYTININPIFL